MSDSDGVFVAATVATIDGIPVVDGRDGHRPWLVNRLVDASALPFVVYVKPWPGYGEAIRAKMSKMNTMARATRLVTGANKRYLSEEGIQARNFIWARVVDQSIGGAILRGTLKTRIERIIIFLDQKALGRPMKEFLFDRIADQRRLLLNTLGTARQLNPAQVQRLESQVAFSRDSVSTHFSDEPEARTAEGGLLLAHYLAKHSHRYLSKGKSPSIFELLSDKGFRDFHLDITQFVVRSISAEAIQEWERKTGLREPKE